MTIQYSHNANSLMPLMTANNAPSPVVVSDSTSLSDAYKACDRGEGDTGWYASGNAGWFEIYTGGDGWVVTSYTIAYNAQYSTYPSAWTFLGSNDGSNWTTLDTKTAQSFDLYEMKTCSISNTQPYTYYKINVTDNNGSSWVGFSEIEFIGTVAFDGADNTSTTPCTLLATSDTAPSPQVITTSDEESGSYPAYCLFDQNYSSVWISPTNNLSVTSVMIDLGAGQEKLVNKYYLMESGYSTNQNPTDWILQGTNNVSATVADGKNVNDWTDLDTRVAGTVNGNSDTATFFTFSCGTAYRYFRLRITDTVGGMATGDSAARAALSQITLVSQRIGALYEETVTEDIDIVDTSLWFNMLLDGVGDEITLTDASSFIIILNSLVADVLQLVDSSGLSLSGEALVSEILRFVDTIKTDLSITVQEALGLTDSTSTMFCLLIADYLNAVDSHVVSWNGTQTVSDRLSILDSIKTELRLTVSDAIVANDTVVVQFWISIFEYLGFHDLATAVGNFNYGVSDTINTTDSVQFGYSQAVLDVLAMVDSSSVIGILLNSIAESLVLSDAASNQLSAIIPVLDTMTITDTVSSQGILYNIVYDTLGMNLTVELDGEVWECYVLNTPKFLPSIYSGFNFNSFCVFENRAYGCKEDGIYELTGDTDNGVAFHTGVQLSETKFGSPNQKRFRKAYVGVSGEQSIVVMETENGLRKAYSIDSDGEVDASRTLRSKKWKLSVVDFDQLDFIKLIPVVLSK